jgi:hypothetical protein
MRWKRRYPAQERHSCPPSPRSGTKTDAKRGAKRGLERKFGPLAAEHRARIDAADAETLLRWGERLLSAETIDDVFRD